MIADLYTCHSELAKNRRARSILWARRTSIRNRRLLRYCNLYGCSSYNYGCSSCNPGGCPTLSPRQENVAQYNPLAQTRNVSSQRQAQASGQIGVRSAVLAETKKTSEPPEERRPWATSRTGRVLPLSSMGEPYQFTREAAAREGAANKGGTTEQGPPSFGRRGLCLCKKDAAIAASTRNHP